MPPLGEPEPGLGAARPPAGQAAGGIAPPVPPEALPVSVTEPMLLFIGCYQIPMYLTPILLARLYRRV